MLNRVPNTKTICNKNNYNILFYLLGCTCLFLSCQTLKSTPIITKNNTHYSKCLHILENHLYPNDLIRVCETLNHKENFQNFAYNLLFTWIIIYCLINRSIKKNLLTPIYWTISYLSAIIFSLLGEIRIFQFSFDTNTNYDTVRIVILSLLCLFISTVFIRQVYFKKINFILVFTIILMYSFIYLLFLTVTQDIVFHFHHALIAGFISLFFTDFTSKFDLYLHAIMIGITIQGFSFFNTQELFLFYIYDLPPPNTAYMIILTFIFLIIWIGSLFIRNKYCNENDYSQINLELREIIL